MSDQVCYCGFKLTELERVLYYVDDLICCNPECLQEVTYRSDPLDLDGYMTEGCRPGSK